MKPSYYYGFIGKYRNLITAISIFNETNVNDSLGF